MNNNSNNQSEYKKPTIFSRIVDFIDTLPGGAVDELTAEMKMSDEESRYVMKNFDKG